MFRFATPSFFALLLVLIPIILFYLYQVYRKKGALQFSHIAYLKSVNRSRIVYFRHGLIVLRLIALCLLIVGLARPQKGRRESETITKGVDILLCIDISSSMRAEDFKPHNRLAAAKKVVQEFIKNRTNDRMGMIIFAKESFTQCPLTLDYGILLNFLERLKIGMVEDGTAIGTAIANCVNRLRESDAKSKVVILLTDGENNAGTIDPITAAQAAAAMNIKIYTIGMGKQGGAPIPIDHPVMGRRYARNYDGSVYLTKIDEKTLKEIAALTDARYFRATNTKKLKKIYAEIGKLEKTKIRTKDYMNYDEKSYGFLLFALGVLLLEITLAHTRFRKVP